MGADEREFLDATLPHADAVHALARRLVPRRDDAEDLVQDTWVRALDAWERTRPDDVGAWLATICLNLGRSAGRRRTTRPETLQADPGARRVAPDDPARAAAARLDADVVHAALWRLPEPQREAIALMDLCGFTAAETGRITGSPRGTVLARVHRGRKALALALRAAGEGPGDEVGPAQRGSAR